MHDAVPEEEEALAEEVRRDESQEEQKEVEQHEAEADAAELYGPPDGYVDVHGNFSSERRSADDKPVYEIELTPDDGLYPLPYMALQKDGDTREKAWLTAWNPVTQKPDRIGFRLELSETRGHVHPSGARLPR